MTDISRFDLDEFVASRFHYRKGQHVTLIAPTDWGKTTLAEQLLAKATGPTLPVVGLVMKPKDSVARAWAKSAGLRRIRTWPPPVWSVKMERPPGWLLWPSHTHDPAIDNDNLWRQFRAAILGSYKAGNRVIFADEVVGLVQTLNLTEELDAVWMRGRSMGCGLWVASQRPAHVPLNAYAQASHLFFGRINDEQYRKRLGEISGIDKRAVADWTASLRKHEWLYISVNGNDGRPAACIINA